MRLLPTLALALATACSSGVEVRGGAGDPRYDFKKLRTYAWAPSEPSGDARIDDALLEKRVHGGVEENLEKKGYRLASGTDADFLVAYRAVLGRERQTTSEKSFEGIWTEDHAPASTDAETAPDKLAYEGTLVLRVLDGREKRLVWEASAFTEINPRDSPLSAAREDKVRVAIRKMLDRFPP